MSAKGAIRASDAARSNAAWCDLVCSAHGAPGECSDTYWLARAAAPPYYPNLVTLTPAVQPALEAIRQLEQAPPSASWAVKDSFAVLPLAGAGFELLFEAEWIARPAAARGAGRPAGWTRIESETALAAWEHAWGESVGQPRIFLPALLRRPEVAFLAGLDATRGMTAGIVAHRAGSLVGVGNFFARGEPGALRAEAIEAASDAFPGLGLVGYECGPALAECGALGFRPLGRLRVWQHARAQGAARP